MAIHLTDTEMRTVNRYIEILLQRFTAGEIDKYETAAKLSHLISAAGEDDEHLAHYVRAEMKNYDDELDDFYRHRIEPTLRGK